MGIWDFRQLQQNIDKKKLPSLVFVFGEEEYLITESLKLIKAHVVDEGTEDFNYDPFFAGDVEAAKVVDTVETLPMMSQRRLVVLRGVEKLKEKSWEQMFPIIDDPVSSCCFVIVSSKVDKRKKYFKNLNKLTLRIRITSLLRSCFFHIRYVSIEQSHIQH